MGPFLSDIIFGVLKIALYNCDGDNASRFTSLNSPFLISGDHSFCVASNFAKGNNQNTSNLSADYHLNPKR